MRIRSVIDTNSEEFAENRRAMLAAVGELQRLQEQVVGGGGSADAAKNARSVARLRSRGKMLPRERIEYLLDDASPFLELSALAGWGSDDPLGGGGPRSARHRDGRGSKNRHQKASGQPPSASPNVSFLPPCRHSWCE